MTENIIKSRSVKACVAEAYRYYADNVRRIFKHTWLPVVVYAVLAGVLSFFVADFSRSALTETSSFSLSLVPACIGALAALVVGVWVTSRVIHLLNGKSRRWNFIRCLRQTAYFLPICVFFAAIVVCAARLLTGSFVFHGLIRVLLLVIFIMLVMPFLYVNTRYVMDEKARYWRDLFRAQRSAVRHGGIIFSTSVVSLVIYLVVALLLMLPLFLLLMAQGASHTGVVIGDPSGMPSTFPLLLSATTTVVTFMMTFFSFWFIFVCVFLYGSIVSDERERRERKQGVQPQNGGQNA